MRASRKTIHHVGVFERGPIRNFVTVTVTKDAFFSPFSTPVLDYFCVSDKLMTLAIYSLEHSVLLAILGVQRRLRLPTSPIPLWSTGNHPHCKFATIQVPIARGSTPNEITENPLSRRPELSAYTRMLPLAATSAFFSFSMETPGTWRFPRRLSYISCTVIVVSALHDQSANSFQLLSSRPMSAVPLSMSSYYYHFP